MDLQGPSKSYSSGKTTPRVEHFDGDIPPALSPLDAFALQSRLLAKQFEESRKAGRRLSRLPPASIARSFSQPRPGYFRSHSSGDSRKPPPSPNNYRNLEIEEPKFRPQSQHPQLSGYAKDDPNANLHLMPGHDFGARRTESPEARSDIEEDSSSRKPQQTVGMGITGAPKQSSQDSASSRYYASNTLAPPPSSVLRPTSSPGLPPPESSDDDYYASSNTGSTFSKPRKMSSSSGMSMPHSPMSHFNHPTPRSTSPFSDIGNMAQGLPKPAFNFSRPLSRSSTSLSLPAPGSSHPPTSPKPETKQQRMQRDRRPAPIEVPKPYEYTEGEDDNNLPSATYTYSKYSLPRGREVSRDSMIFGGLQTPHFEWKEPLFESSPPPSRSRETQGEAAPSVPPDHFEIPKSPLPEAAPARTVPVRRATEHDLPRSKHGRNSFEQGIETLPVKQKAPNESAEPNPQPSANGDDSKLSREDTIRLQKSQSERKAPMQLTADEHVDKGIECHEKGSLKESTYHLRLAAMQNHPTGMLLYALACRHGWGVRPNQKEGVQWLRKAVDAAGIDINNVDVLPDQLRGRDRKEQQARQAQFALGIYELGVSHLNGWGIEQDKVLALRCFEIAGRWGDTDALAEAGYCYVEGVGCKKDLKKAAKYYRMAESKGMSMVGNSW